MKLMVILFIFSPCLVFGQKIKDDYSIYSKYLEVFKHEHGNDINFVIRVSLDRRKEIESSTWDILDDSRSYLKGSQTLGFFRREFFRDTLKKDTMWLPLIAALDQEQKQVQFINGKLLKDLPISMLSDYQYDEYFGNNRVEEGWASFHEDYPGKSFLITLSRVVRDEKRAAFYFSSQCGGLCGHGCLVLFYKDLQGWRYVGTLSMWNA